MGAFFSGQDTKTLNIEGNDTNCFVSLIVDTRGTYQAAITRKVNKKKEVITKIYGSTYEFFGDGTKVLDGGGGDGIRTDASETIIEYFMLDVQREETNNPLDYLDARFEEIERQKKPATHIVNNNYIRAYDPKKADTTLVKFGSDYDEDMSFREYRNKSQEVKQPALFGEDIMNEMIDPLEWTPDPTIIHKLLTQMITCSLIIGDIDLKQWVTRHMEKKYEELFADTMQLDSWMEFIVEFILNQYPCDNVPESVMDDFDTYQCKIAEALADEMGELPCNSYLEQLGEILGRYIFGS